MRVLLTLCLFAVASVVQAEARSEKISWTDYGKTFDGVLVWDDSSKAPRPGIVMVPNWYGVNESAVAKAKTIAGSDYVVLVADVYGRGARPKDADEAGKMTAAVSADADALRSRVNAALATLRSAAGKAPVDTARVAAIGFCFGGMVALELVRGGADVAGVVTFHGNLSTRAPARPGGVKAQVLVLNGADDNFVSAESIAAFQKEMRDARADWQFVNYGGAVHCFAEPDEHGAVPGCTFHEASYRRGMAQMRAFLAEAFEKRSR